jgi:uncharacterized protein
MAIVFVTTGIMGAVYAYSYAKTGSLYIACGIHLGWNITQGFVFSQGPIGDGILRLVKPQPVVNVSLFVYIMITFLPILSAWAINYWLLRRKKQVAFVR